MGESCKLSPIYPLHTGRRGATPVLILSCLIVAFFDLDLGDRRCIIHNLIIDRYCYGPYDGFFDSRIIKFSGPIEGKLQFATRPQVGKLTSEFTAISACDEHTLSRFQPPNLSATNPSGLGGTEGSLGPEIIFPACAVSIKPISTAQDAMPDTAAMEGLFLCPISVCPDACRNLLVDEFMLPYLLLRERPREAK